MKTIIFKREVDENNILEIAKRKGYKETITEKITEEITLEEARANGYYIQEVLPGGENCIAVVEEKEIPNPETPEEYLAKVYQKMIDDDIKKIVKEIKTEDLKKEYEEKIQATEEAVEQNVGETEIEIL